MKIKKMSRNKWKIKLKLKVFSWRQIEKRLENLNPV